MARVTLIVPHLPQRMGSPYLGQQYIAASLMGAGHEVQVLDLAAILFTGDDADAVAAVERFGPDVIGMTLFTYNARRGYVLAERLQGKARLLVAGGPHPTVCPAEPLDYGFDVVVSGEGEWAIRHVLDHLDDPEAMAAAPGVRTRDATGPPRASIEDLDALPFPLESYPAYEIGWYAKDRQVVPGGLMTSRGCPARCTFCANYVTGRAYRWRSPQNVIAEMLRLKDEWGVRHFPFWDDAFTARRPRLNALCDAILAEPGLRGVTWTCITPGNMVKPRDLARMREAGCVAINFGIESGDYNILKVIQKGQKPEQVKAAVAAAKAEGMTTIVNFMFGFPQEGPQELQHTLELMDALSADTDFFNNRGVLVPFPGTAVYDRWHKDYGFTRWWLDPAMIVDEPNIHVLDPQASQAYLEHDPSLELDFFRYSDAVRDLIAQGVRYKARHNASSIARMSGRATTAVLQQEAAASVG